MIWYRNLMLMCGFCVCSAWAALGNECGPEDGESYQFQGTHFIASYTGCDPEALTHLSALSQTMLEAVKRCGATVLKSAEHIFPPDGFTMVVLLSESHASIHTYPEHQACFVDLFTCGNKCSFEEFDNALREYLQPGDVNSRVLIRGLLMEEKVLFTPNFARGKS